MDDSAKIRKSEINNENVKKKIQDRMTLCDNLLAEQTLSLERLYEQTNDLYRMINQRKLDFCQQIDQYQNEIENLLKEQEKVNEINV